jgi:hypothetical protein
MTLISIIKQDTVSFYTRLSTLTLKMYNILISELII